MLYGCVTWSPRACHYDTLRRAHRSFLTRCIVWRNNNRPDHPILHLDTLIQTGSEKHRGDYTQEGYLVRGICGTHGRYEIAEVRHVRRTGGGRGLRGEPGKRVERVFPGRPQSFRHQRRPLDDYSPARTRRNGARRWNKGRNFSWRNSSLQKKPRYEWRELVSTERMSCYLSLALRLVCFRISCFHQSRAALCSIVPR